MKRFLCLLLLLFTGALIFGPFALTAANYRYPASAGLGDGDHGDFTCTAGSCLIDSNSIALTTDTTGNYVASVATAVLTGLTGGAAGSEGTAISLAFDYSATLAADPALAASNCVFGTTGLICEGATANGFETLTTFTDPTADRTFTYRDASGTVILSGDTFTGDVTATLDTDGSTALTVAADSVALTTDTSGNYVASTNTSVLTGLTGGSAGSEAAALTLAFDYSATLAADPTLAASNCVFGTTGLICEGATANGFEALTTFADVTGDRTYTAPDRSGTFALSGDTFTGDVTGTIDASGATALTVADNSVDGTDIALGSDAQGDVYYHNGTDVVRLPKGTSGQFLQIGASIPAWATVGGGGFVYGGYSQSAALSADGYCSVSPPEECSGTRANVTHNFMPVACTASKMYISVFPVPGAGTSYAWTLEDDAVATAITCTTSNTTGECTDLTNTAAIAAGSVITIFGDETGAAATVGALNVQFLCTP